MFTSGFFNSINSDRKYNAEQMAAIFDGLITDGIFDSIGDHFQVTPASSGLGVNIGTGRAWLNQTWSYNDTAYPVTLGAASSSLGRKDLICLKVDKSNAVRANSLVVIAGTPAASPVEPTVTDDTTNGIYYHKLAAVTIPKGATSISAANITNYIGLASGTPYVTGLLSSTTVDELWSQWDGEFNDWWDDIKETLDDNVVTMILNKIDRITPKEATMNLYGFSHINPPPSGMEYKEYSTDAILNQISSLLNGKLDGDSLEDKYLYTVFTDGLLNTCTFVGAEDGLVANCQDVTTVYYGESMEQYGTSGTSTSPGSYTKTFMLAPRQCDPGNNRVFLTKNHTSDTCKIYFDELPKTPGPITFEGDDVSVYFATTTKGSAIARGDTIMFRTDFNSIGVISGDTCWRNNSQTCCQIRYNGTYSQIMPVYIDSEYNLYICVHSTSDSPYFSRLYKLPKTAYTTSDSTVYVNSSGQLVCSFSESGQYTSPLVYGLFCSGQYLYCGDGEYHYCVDLLNGALIDSTKLSHNDAPTWYAGSYDGYDYFMYKYDIYKCRENEHGTVQSLFKNKVTRSGYDRGIYQPYAWLSRKQLNNEFIPYNGTFMNISTGKLSRTKVIGTTSAPRWTGDASTTNGLWSGCGLVGDFVNKPHGYYHLNGSRKPAHLVKIISKKAEN